MSGKPRISPNLVAPETNEVVGLQGRHRLLKTKDSPRNARYLRTGSWIEKERQNLQAYEYLCHIGEVKEWIESIIGEEIASITSLDEDLRNGIVLAKLVQKFEPGCVKRIFEGAKLQYRHSDNINYVFAALNKIGLPDNFKFELTDLYEKKNIPKVIYCLHALSHLLYKRGLAPSINNLIGYLQFTDEQIHSTQKQLDTSGVALPAFKQIRSQLAREMNEPETKSTTELDMSTQVQNIIAIQSIVRGYLTRKSWLQRDELAEKGILLPQAFCRGLISRRAYKNKKEQLGSSVLAISKLQAQCRGLLVKNAHQTLKHSLSKPVVESSLSNLQAVCRSTLSRKLYHNKIETIKASQSDIISLQALCKSHLSRKVYQDKRAALKNSCSEITSLQALCKSHLSRKAYQHKKAALKNSASEIISLQALCKSHLSQKAYQHKKADLKNSHSKIISLQALCKSHLSQKAYHDKKAALKNSHSKIISLQALCKSHLSQKAYQDKKAALNNSHDVIERLQAQARSHMVQKNMAALKLLLRNSEFSLSRLQAIGKGRLARAKFINTNEELLKNQASIINLQALSRGSVARRAFQTKKTAITNQDANITQLQALVRGCLSRKRWLQRTEDLNEIEYDITRTQALARGLLVRARWTKLLTSLNEYESKITQLQAMARGLLSRKAVSVKMEYYQEHEEVVVKIQSAFRAKMAKRAYYEMSMKNDPPVSAMRNFLYLLDDSEADFTAELELEKLRQKVVRTIRENKATEAELSELDIKIALLVKNRITIDEVVKSSKGLFQNKRSSVMDGSSTMGSSSSSNLSTIGGAFSLKNLDRESRNRLKNYQFLFYLLQTQPQYLARMLVFNKGQLGDRAKKFIETVVLTLFNFAQSSREEYLLLKLFKQSIEEEINSVDKIEEFLRGNPVFIQLAVHYNRGAKERKYLRDLLQPIIKPILENKDLDLETDPVCIYRGVIREEESRTGTKSKRKYNVTKQSALNDPETKAAFIKHLQQLRSITSDVIDAILESLDAMPYGVRYIAKELKLALTRKFPDERPSTIIKVVGHLVYYRYINPAITAPELFDVIETVINSIQRKNLAEVAKMLNQVSMGKLFSDENIFLQPLNNFIGFTAEKFARYFQSVTEVDEPEVHFEIDEFLDQINTRKPTIYISYNEIISLHRIIADNEDLIAPSEDDPIHPVLKTLGAPPQLMNYEDRSLGKEIALVLSDPSGPNHSQAEQTQQIFLETKRQVLYVIKVQSGSTLLEILNKPVSASDELRYASILDEEIDRATGSGNQPIASPIASPTLSDSATIHSVTHSVDILTNDFLINLRRLTLQQLKDHILKNMASLEAGGMVSTDNGYQAMVNAIARDIKNKHQRKKQRSDEFRKVRQTLANLAEATSYLSDQKTSYHSYISTCMANLRVGKSKGRHRPRPFSRQYFHAKGLERAGKMPKFGSYKYGADELYRRGILISIAKFNPSDFGKMSLTISSDEMGVFHVEASLLGIKVPNAKVELRFDEILQAQFDNMQTLALFDDTVKVNVNLLLYLINKKFYT